MRPAAAGCGFSDMIDNLAILISHALLGLAFWRLTLRDDLDSEPKPGDASRNPRDA